MSAFRVLQTAGAPGFDERFEAILSASAEATFFHTRTWAAIVTASFPGLEDLSLILESDGRPHAVPLFRWRGLGGALVAWHSSFPFLYGGPIPGGAQALAMLLGELAARRGSIVLMGNPFPPARGAAAVGPTGAPVDGEATGGAAPPPATLPLLWETTHLLALPAQVDTYWSRVLDTRKRNDIRRLARKGVVVETTREAEDLRAIYALYRRRMATWRQRPGLVYPPALYETMLARGGAAVRCYVARHEGRLIGGTFITRYNGIVHYNAGYFDDRARALRPNVLIQERIIRDAIEDGMRIYDMLPSAGLANVEEFKESFGGVRTRFPRWERVGTLQRWIHGARRRARRAAPRSSHEQ
ncbi:MAG: GNAT family N-acetyltransferase [Candidatus Eisenbacteria bacterium]